jgi:hypothetical protein
MLPIKYITGPSKEMVYDVDGETFSQERDARLFAGAESMLRGLRMLLESYPSIKSLLNKGATAHPDEVFAKNFETYIKEMRSLVACVDGSLVKDLEALQTKMKVMQNLFKNYHNKAIGSGELMTGLAEELGCG